jgi:hypothetical protein
MKACSTLVPFLAFVSKKGILISSAKAWFPEQGIRLTRKSVRTNRDRQQPRAMNPNVTLANPRMPLDE